MRKPVTKDSTASEDRNHYGPQPGRQLYGEVCPEESLAQGHSQPGMTQVGGYQVFSYLLLCNKLPPNLLV